MYDNKSATTEARIFRICQSPLPTALGSRVLSQNKISVLVRVLVIKSIRTRTRCFISPTISPILLQFTLLIQFWLHSFCIFIRFGDISALIIKLTMLVPVDSLLIFRRLVSVIPVYVKVRVHLSVSS